MENIEQKPYDPSNYERATLEEYGYKEHKALKITWKVVSIILLVFAALMIYYSVIIIAIQSVNSNKLPNKFASFTFDNYANMFTNSQMNESIKNTFLVSICATAIATVFGTLVGIGAYFLPPKAKARLTLINNIPLLNADIVTGISFMLIFLVIKNIFPYVFGFWSILAAHVYFIMPYIVLSVMPKMKEIDPNMLDASLDLGVKPMHSLRKVIIPAIKGGIFSGMVLAFTISFEDFAVSYFNKGNGFQTFSIWTYVSANKKSLFEGAYAFSTFITLIMILGIVAYNFLVPFIKDKLAKREMRKNTKGSSK